MTLYKASTRVEQTVGRRFVSVQRNLQSGNQGEIHLILIAAPQESPAQDAVALIAPSIHQSALPELEGSAPLLYRWLSRHSTIFTIPM